MLVSWVPSFCSRPHGYHLPSHAMNVRYLALATKTRRAGNGPYPAIGSTDNYNRSEAADC